VSDSSQPISRRSFIAAAVAAAVAASCSSGSSAPEAAETTAAAPTSAPATTPTGTPTTAPTSAPAATPTATASPEPKPEPTVAALELQADPFMHGVASGDPLDDSVILWTRLDPSAGLPDGDVEVTWEVAVDPDMAEMVASGAAMAVAALGHSVHVDATGLSADTIYHYRFSLGGYASTVGRTRTFAAVGTQPERFRFAFSSCQNWEQGYYAAYRDLVEQDNLDAFVFLGDYIYEYASGGYADPRGRQTGQDFECETVQQYRDRYALYRTDPLLQAAHAKVPWIITWDDHEVDNDYAGATSENNDDSQVFLARRAAAYQVWYEFTPVRLDPPRGPDYDIYRAYAHGDLIRFHVLDTRQYRTDQQTNEPFLETLGQAVQERDDAKQFSDQHTMLGTDQFDWLVAGVRESDAVWDVLAQQVFMFGGNALPGGDPPVVVVDTWDGYAGERQRLLQAIGVGSTDGADNLVVLTGDFHSAAVGVLRSDPFDAGLPVVGVEFMASSISSSFFDGDAAVAGLVDLALSTNPQLRFFDTRRGYTLCDVTPEMWTATYRAVADQFDETASVETISTWSVAAGTAEVEQIG